MRRTPLCLTVALALSLAGCKTLFGTEGADVEYAPDAKGNLARGVEALQSRDYTSAQKYFEFLRNKYPYSDFAKEAELKIADIAWDKEDFTDARDRYTNFVKLHPGYPKSDYAAFRAAAAHYQEFRKQSSDFFLFPPAYEKDQTELKSAYQSLTDYVEGYPTSKYVEDANKLLADCRHRLAQHELYVGAFYAKRNQWAGAAGRWETVMSKYPSGGEDQEAAFKLADAYRKHLHEPQKARDVLRLVMDRYPNSPAAARAERLLGS